MEIFLSHSKKDVAFCEQLANDLKAAGVKVWYAGWDLEVGDSLTEKLAKEITSKGYFGIVLSPDSVSSAWVRFELRTALANENAKYLTLWLIWSTWTFAPTTAQLCAVCSSDSALTLMQRRQRNLRSISGIWERFSLPSALVGRRGLKKR